MISNKNLIDAMMITGGSYLLTWIIILKFASLIGGINLA